jgi:hypothetical protein
MTCCWGTGEQHMNARRRSGVRGQAWSCGTGERQPQVEPGSDHAGYRSRCGVTLHVDDAGLVPSADQVGHQGFTLAHAAVSGL